MKHPGEITTDMLGKAQVIDGHVIHGRLAESVREQIGIAGSKKREDMPGHVFLLPAQRKYPVKRKKDGQWLYSVALLLAAARRARMQGREELARRADSIRARLTQESKSG